MGGEELSWSDMIEHEYNSSVERQRENARRENGGTTKRSIGELN